MSGRKNLRITDSELSEPSELSSSIEKSEPGTRFSWRLWNEPDISRNNNITEHESSTDIV